MSMEEGSFGGKMELLKLSRLKLQLRALISEARDLRERERSASEQLQLSIQKQKQYEEEFGRKLKELESALASSIESRQKLERKVDYLQNDNLLLENKQTELNATIQGLLESKEHFVNAYEDSICDLKRSIETRDRKLKVFSEKLSSHMQLFDSIEKEALSVKQVVDNVKHLICDKEEIVTGLKRKLDKVSEVEKVFIGKINEMEIQLGKYKDEIQMKDRIISELEAKLQAENIVNKNQAQMEELKRALSMKEAVIQDLILERQALESEVNSLEAILKKIEHAFKEMNGDVKGHSFQVESKERFCMVHEVVDSELLRTNDSRDASGRCSESQLNLGNFPVCREKLEKNDKEFQVEEPACSTTHVACSGPQSITNAQTTSANDVKSNCTIIVNQPESESSTTQAENGEHPD